MTTACTTCNKTNDQLKRCSKCHCAMYCDESCQRENFPKHRLWCKAAANALACTRCIVLDKSFPGMLILHADDVADSSKSIGRPLNSQVYVFHAPFVSKVSSELAACTPIIAQFDIIFLMDGQVIYGMWATDFTESKLSLIWNKRNDQCSVCHEMFFSKDRVLCRRCYSPACIFCIHKMGDDESCPGAQTYRCPTCRGIMIGIL